jgi:hypothetical protein
LPSRCVCSTISGRGRQPYKAYGTRYSDRFLCTFTVPYLCCPFQFRISTGAIASIEKPGPYLRVPEGKDAQGPETGDPDEDLSDDDLLGPTEGQDAAAPSESGEINTTGNDDVPKSSIDPKKWARYQDLLRQKDDRMDFFVEKTEEATKTFFSSYYHDKGLLWLAPHRP